jgi:hypothetical protein
LVGAQRIRQLDESIIWFAPKVWILGVQGLVVAKSALFHFRLFGENSIRSLAPPLQIKPTSLGFDLVKGNENVESFKGGPGGRCNMYLCCGARKFCGDLHHLEFPTAATPYASLYLALRALGNVPPALLPTFGVKSRTLVPSQGKVRISLQAMCLHKGGLCVTLCVI